MPPTAVVNFSAFNLWIEILEVFTMMSVSSKKTKASASCEQSTWKKPRSECVYSGGEITTKAAFDEKFGRHGYQIEREDSLQMTEWGDKEGREMIRAWLCTLGNHFASTPASKVRLISESALFPLLTNVLIPVLNVCKYKLEAAKNVIEAPTAEEIDQAAELIVAQSREQALSNPDAEPGDDHLPATVDTTDAAAVEKLVRYIEKRIRPEVFQERGKVEMAIVDPKKYESQAKVAVLEGKLQLTLGDCAGFYQCAAFMAQTGCRYGILTSYATWKFLRVDTVRRETVDEAEVRTTTDVRLIRHTDLLPLMKPALDRLDELAVDVYAHLLEICGVARSTDLLASAAATAASTIEHGKYVTLTMEMLKRK
jgi:hypothetical protein